MNGAGRKPRTELTLMIRPLPCSRMWGSTARVIRIEPKTLVSNSARVCSIELSSAAPAMPKPALLTRTSIRPDRSSTSRTTPSTDPSSVTSSGRNTTPPRSSPAAALRLVPYTVNPAPTSARAAASPIPADAPVTSATGRVSRAMTAPSLDCITIIISQYGHNAMNTRTGATDLGGPRHHAERRRRLEGRPQRCPGAAMWSVRPRVRMVAAPESEPGRSARENGPDPRSAEVAFATGEHYVIRLILRICLSKIRAGTRRRSMLTRPAPEPAVYRSFGLGSVSAATITLAITAGPGDRDALPHGAGRRKVIRDLAGSQMAQCRTPALGSHCGQWLLGVPQRGRPVRRVVQRRLTHATQRARDSRSVPA